MKPRYPAFILLNPAAGGDRAGVWWKRIADSLDSVLDPQVLFEWAAPGTGITPRELIEQDRRVAARIKEAVSQGRRLFVAAGGDGTVQLLADALMRTLTWEERQSIQMGAIGLGSSNDFHKPVHRDHRIAEWPVRLDYPQAAGRDVGLLEIYDDPDSEVPSHRHHFLVSASIGIVALGNQLFNAGDGLIGLTKGFWTNAAISLAAVSACARHRPLHLTLSTPDEPNREEELVHFGVMKSPYLAGSLRYDFDVSENDGRFGVALARRMSRASAFLSMLALLRSRFSQKRHHEHFQVPVISATASETIPVELDGEVLAGRRFDFQVMPRSLRVCGSGLPV